MCVWTVVSKYRVVYIVAFAPFRSRFVISKRQAIGAHLSRLSAGSASTQLSVSCISMAASVGGFHFIQSTNKDGYQHYLPRRFVGWTPLLIGADFRTAGSVSYEERSQLVGQKGATVWLTGLSASGKVSLQPMLEVHRS